MKRNEESLHSAQYLIDQRSERAFGMERTILAIFWNIVDVSRLQILSVRFCRPYAKAHVITKPFENICIVTFHSTVFLINYFQPSAIY